MPSSCCCCCRRCRCGYCCLFRLFFCISFIRCFQFYAFDPRTFSLSKPSFNDKIQSDTFVWCVCVCMHERVCVRVTVCHLWINAWSWAWAHTRMHATRTYSRMVFTLVEKAIYFRITIHWTWLTSLGWSTKMHQSQANWWCGPATCWTLNAQL